MEVPDVQEGDNDAAAGERGDVQPREEQRESSGGVHPGDFGLSYGDIYILHRKHSAWSQKVRAVRKKTLWLIDEETAKRWLSQAEKHAAQG